MKKKLRSILEEEFDSVKELLSTLEEQHSLLVFQDVFKLESIIERIDQCSRNLARCEGKRRALVGQQLMSKLVENIDDEELTVVYDDLVRELNLLMVQKETNELLIRQSLSYTNSIMDMISPRKETLTYNGYGKMKR
ncbi:MAG TPA: flagellar protein FlgN [Clostridium sp.]|nr:flagellar protein FlgN [Clostridium sp.]